MNMKIYTSALIYFLFTCIGLAQTLFQQTVGKSGITTNGSAIVQTANGFVVSGKLGPINRAGIFGLDSAGSVLWSKQYSVSNDYPVKMLGTSDNGYIIGGNAKVTSNSQLMFLKVDALGVKQWAKTIGGSGIELCLDMKITLDGGYIMVGKTASYGAGSSNFYAVKMDATGAKEWDYAYSPSPGAGTQQIANAVCEIPSGGFVISGYSDSFSGSTGNTSSYIVRTGTDGTQLWYKSYAFESSVYDIINAASTTQDGGLIFTGNTRSPNGSGGDDIFLMKTDSAGEVKWSKTYGGLGDESAYVIQQTNDKGYIFGGKTTSFKEVGSFDSDFYLLKTDSLGNLEWSKTYGNSSTGTSESIASIVTTTDGGYALSGNTGIGKIGYNAAYIIKTDALGNSHIGDLCTAKNPPTIVNPVATFSTTPSSGVTSAAVAGGAFTVILNITATDYSVNAIPVTQPGAIVNSDATICLGDSISLFVTGVGSNYSWSPIYALTATQNDTVKAGPSVTTSYQAKVSNLFCTDSASVLVTLNIPPAKITSSKKTICQGEIIQLSASGGSSYLWSPPAGIYDTTAANTGAAPLYTTRYKLIAWHGLCNKADSINIVVNPNPTINVTESTTICEGEIIQLSASGGTFYAWTPGTGLNFANIANPLATPVTTTTYSVTTSNGLCLAGNKVTVQVTQLAKADFIFDIRDGTFTNLSTAADNYSWNFGDNTSSTLTTPPPHIYTDGKYLAQLVATNACNSDTATLAIIAEDVGMSHLLNNKNVYVFPNPNNGHFSIQAPYNEIQKIKLSDAAGNMVYEVNGANQLNNNQLIEFNHLTKGLYTLLISGKQTIVTKKIIVF